MNKDDEFYQKTITKDRANLSRNRENLKDIEFNNR